MAIPALAVTVMPLLKQVLDMLPNPEARARAEREITLALVQIEAEQRIAQVKLNTVEAQHKSLFVAGWRPFIGWVGGFSLLWTFLIYPMATWIAQVSGYTGSFPQLDTAELLSLVLAMLGVGAMRSFDKMQGTDTRSIGTPKETKPFYND